MYKKAIFNKEKIGIEQLSKPAPPKQYNVGEKVFTLKTKPDDHRLEEKMKRKSRRGVLKSLDTVHLDGVDEPVCLIIVSTNTFM